MSDPALVIIARAPEAGRVKTRLAAGIGAAGALAVYRQLLDIVAEVQAAWRGPVLLTASGSDAAWADTGLARVPRRAQVEGGLGQRIAAALHWGVATSRRAIAIGTDCPGLRVEHLWRLAQGLDTAPVAFGPAEDGGYWAVAVADARVIPVLSAESLPWSTPHLLQASHERLAAAGIAHATGDTLADCDDADDFAVAATAGFLTWPHPIEARP